MGKNKSRRIAAGVLAVLLALTVSGCRQEGETPAGAPEELLLKPVRELVERECYGRHVGKVPRIVTAELGGDAGLIGAASLRNVN